MATGHSSAGKGRGVSDDVLQAAMDPNSPFPEPDLRSEEQQEHVREWVGPAGSGKAMNLSYSDPVKQGESGGTDRTEGINRDVGQFMGAASHRHGAKHMASGVGSDKMHSGTTNE